MRSTIDPHVILLSKVDTPEELELYGSWMTTAEKSGELWAFVETDHHPSLIGQRQTISGPATNGR